MTTKEQERKALEQIRKIVEGLGEYSYIATAFAGCFEDAETNIENDFAFSMKDRYESSERELNKVGEELMKAREHIKRLEDTMRHYEEEKEDQDYLLKREREAKQAALKTLEETQNEIRDMRIEVEEAEYAVKTKDEEIIHLKAKLYDMITK